MGKKGYNWKARHAPTIEIDDSNTKKISVDIKHYEDNYDACNALVLPSTKRKTKNKDRRDTTVRLLSKKRRKQLEKVVERKQKKLKRVDLLENLAKVQAPTDEIKQYISITTLQTKGLKRHFQESNSSEYKPTILNNEIEDEPEEIINAIRGSKKKRLSLLMDDVQEKRSTDPNVIELDDSSESDVESSGVSDNDNNDNNKIIDEPKSAKETPSIKKDDILKKEPLIPIKPSVRLPQAEPIAPKKPPKGKLDATVRTRSVFVGVDRKPEVQEARMKLPVLAEEQSIVEAINENPVVIITGETGSGKTTQLPQFLYEAGYAKTRMIGVTEPRRVAAMSMSKRVGYEMNLTSREVSYLIRFEGNVTEDTKIKFMTDGVLLKEIQRDFLLTKYSVIILDEAHERSVYTDILIGLLSRIVPLRAKRNDPLKMVVMSATLRVEDFVDNPRLFKVRPPVIKVESRQFPVTVHFNRRTSSNYVLDAIRKVAKIHSRLPDGGILVFLTGQREVNTVVNRLRKAFPYRKKKFSTVNKNTSDEEKDENKGSDSEDSEEELNARNAIKRMKQKRKKLELPKVDLDNYSAVPTDDTQEDFYEVNDFDADENIDENEDEDEDILELKSSSTSQPLWVLPLYSLLPGHQQAKVFEPIPEGCRLCVVSTNVAETSLTIPNVKYVVDSGRCKVRMYDKVTGVSTYRVCYASQAAANQRAGRAGRTGPGHCYRLFSSAVFNDQFELYSEPEIRRKPIDDLLLQMKVMNIEKVVNFPFPSPPDVIQLKSAEKRLRILGALEQVPLHRPDTYTSKATPLGRSIAAFPVAPRYGKMLAISQQQKLLKYTVCMVAALSVEEILVEALGTDGKTKSKWLQTRRFWAGTANCLLLGDPMVLIRAVGAAEYAGSKGEMQKFCEEHGVRPKAIAEVRKLRQQLTNEIVVNIPNLNLDIDPNMTPPTDTEAKFLRQLVLAGMGDQIARKVSQDEIKENEDKINWKHAYKTLEMEDPVFMHSSCVLRRTSPEWVVYQELYETNKMYMRGVTAIEPEWLVKFVPGLCRMRGPMPEPPPRYDEETGRVLCYMSGTFGPQGWELPAMELEHPTDRSGVQLFARYLLEGKVFPKLERFVPSLLAKPSSISASWAKLLQRNEIMFKALLSKGVMSRNKLLEVWSKDKDFLLTAYKKWLPESAHGEVTLMWPPLD